VATLRYITHPQVAVDLTVPVTTWKLSAHGRERATRFAQQPWLASVGRIVCSAETKAWETARILGSQLGLEPEVRANSGENDRSATGPLPPAEFEALANRYFAEPDDSVRGWESARAAQRRIAAELDDLLRSAAASDIAVIGHGGVGTLWYCHLMSVAIDRCHDQPSQGHYFTVDRASARPLHGWRALEDPPG
jgi:broad specificity phosphatase PhoE